jgi:hypothetical protein
MPLDMYGVPGQVYAPLGGGNQYLAAPVTGLIAAVADHDVDDLINAGCVGSAVVNAAAALGAVTSVGGRTGAVTVFDGVIGGVTPAAGTFTTLGASGFVRDSVAAGLTAVGTDRASSLPLNKAINIIGTAAAGTGVTLEASATIGVGGHQDIYHDGANAIKVYGNGSDTIDTVAAATGVTLTNARRCRYTVTAAGVIKSALLGAVST